MCDKLQTSGRFANTPRATKTQICFADHWYPPQTEDTGVKKKEEKNTQVGDRLNQLMAVIIYHALRDAIAANTYFRLSLAYATVS